MSRTNEAGAIGNFEQPVLPVTDIEAFGAIRLAVEASFSSSDVTAFLKSLQQKGVRVRDFESVLAKGLLGAPAKSEYAKLDNADRGQIREFYLASLERVTPELRQKFFKLYAYY